MASQKTWHFLNRNRSVARIKASAKRGHTHTHTHLHATRTKFVRFTRCDLSEWEKVRKKWRHFELRNWLLCVSKAATASCCQYPQILISAGTNRKLDSQNGAGGWGTGEQNVNCIYTVSLAEHWYHPYIPFTSAIPPSECLNSASFLWVMCYTSNKVHHFGLDAWNYNAIQTWLVSYVERASNVSKVISLACPMQMVIMPFSLSIPFAFRFLGYLITVFVRSFNMDHPEMLSVTKSMASTKLLKMWFGSPNSCFGFCVDGKLLLCLFIPSSNGIIRFFKAAVIQQLCPTLTSPIVILE